MSFVNRARPHLSDPCKPVSPAKPSKNAAWVGNNPCAPQPNVITHKLQQMRGSRTHHMNPLFSRRSGLSTDDERRKDMKTVMIASGSPSEYKENGRLKKHQSTNLKKSSPMFQTSKESMPSASSSKKILCEKNENCSIYYRGQEQTPKDMIQMKASCRRIDLFKAASDSSRMISAQMQDEENMAGSLTTQMLPLATVGSQQFQTSSAFLSSSPTVIHPTAALPYDELYQKTIPAEEEEEEEGEEGEEERYAEIKSQNGRDRPKWQLDRIHIPLSRVDSEEMDSADTCIFRIHEDTIQSPSSGKTPTSAFASLPVSHSQQDPSSQKSNLRFSEGSEASSAMVEAGRSSLSEEKTVKTENVGGTVLAPSPRLTKVEETDGSIHEEEDDVEVTSGRDLRVVICTVLLIGIVGFVCLEKGIRFQASGMKLMKGCEGLWPTHTQIPVDMNQLHMNLNILKQRFDITLETIAATIWSSFNQWNPCTFSKSSIDCWKNAMSLWPTWLFKFYQDIFQKVVSQPLKEDQHLSFEDGKWDWSSEYDVFLEKHIFKSLSENEKEFIQNALFSPNSPKSRALLFAINNVEEAMQIAESETLPSDVESQMLSEGINFHPIGASVSLDPYSMEQEELPSLAEIHSDENFLKEGNMQAVPYSMEHEKLPSLVEIHSDENFLKERNMQAGNNMNLPQDIPIANRQGQDSERNQQGVEISYMKPLQDEKSSELLTEQNNEIEVFASASISSTNKVMDYLWWITLFLLPLILGLPILLMHLKLINLGKIFCMDIPAAGEALIKLSKSGVLRKDTSKSCVADATDTPEQSNLSVISKEELIMSPETFKNSPFGSFIAYKRVVAQQGSGTEQIRLTPVRRSNRILHQAFSPSYRGVESPGP